MQSARAKGSLRQHAERRLALRPKTNNRQTLLFSSSAHTSNATPSCERFRSLRVPLNFTSCLGARFSQRNIFSRTKLGRRLSVGQTKKGLRFKFPKTRNSRRNVSILPWLPAELKAHRARQQERRLAIGLGRTTEDDLVFARQDGGVRAPHWLTQKSALAMDALEVDCTLHALRHTHVSQLIAAGLDVLTISRRLGHASAAITLAVYGHLFANTDARAAEIMEAAFRRTE